MGESNAPKPYRRLFRRDPRAEIDDELLFHLEQRMREYVAAGMDEEAARAKAQARFGDLKDVEIRETVPLAGPDHQAGIEGVIHRAQTAHVGAVLAHEELPPRIERQTNRLTHPESNHFQRGLRTLGPEAVNRTPAFPFARDHFTLTPDLGSSVASRVSCGMCWG